MCILYTIYYSRVSKCKYSETVRPIDNIITLNIYQ